MSKTKHPVSAMTNIPKGFLTRGEVAHEIGKSKDTIRRWHESGRFVTKHSIKRGKLRIWLYDKHDLAELKELARTVRPGRQTHGD